MTTTSQFILHTINCSLLITHFLSLHSILPPHIFPTSLHCRHNFSPPISWPILNCCNSLRNPPPAIGLSAILHITPIKYPLWRQRWAQMAALVQTNYEIVLGTSPHFQPFLWCPNLPHSVPRTVFGFIPLSDHLWGQPHTRYPSLQQTNRADIRSRPPLSPTSWGNFLFLLPLWRGLFLDQYHD